MEAGGKKIFYPCGLTRPMHELPDTVALDVVILPPEPITELAISANRILLAGNPDGAIRLGKEDCLPHISVAIFPARRDDIPGITAEIDRISRSCSPMTLVIDAIAKRRARAGEIVSSFHIPRPEVLQLFHKTVMRSMKPYTVPPTGPGMFVGDVSAPSIDCLYRFPKTSTYERYSPHITLGSGDLPELIPGIDLPVRFEAKEAAICHLGGHCTCRRVLARFSLGAGAPTGSH